MRRRVVVAFCAGLLALVAAGRASAYGRAELSLRMDDGTVLAATLYEPSAPPPYPAIVLFHGLGGKREDLDFVAQSWADTFAVLSFDARGHGHSEGLVSIDGPREIADTRVIYNWLAARPEIDNHAIGAWGISLGGGAVLRSLAEGVPWTAVETVQSWTDLYSALAPQNLSKSGVIYSLLSSVPAAKLDPSVQAIEQDAIASRNLGALRQFAAQRSSRAFLSQVATPTYFFQGLRDFAFDIAQASAGFRLLKGRNGFTSATSGTRLRRSPARTSPRSFTRGRRGSCAGCCGPRSAQSASRSRSRPTRGAASRRGF